MHLGGSKVATLSIHPRGHLIDKCSLRVVVTAQKREERLIDVPQSVSVLSADALTHIGAMQFRDYADTIPGMAYNTTGAGYTQVVLRGVTTGYETSSPVAIYVDEVPLGASGVFSNSTRMGLDAALFDLERIEVLRGPQGTLYGAGAVGGAVKYVTKQPSTKGIRGADAGRPGVHGAWRNELQRGWCSQHSAVPRTRPRCA